MGMSVKALRALELFTTLPASKTRRNRQPEPQFQEGVIPAGFGRESLFFPFLEL
jgi:hypothetical protein